MNRKSPQLRHRNLPLLLLQARERVISHFRPILNANNITEQQWRIIRALIDAKALEPRQIGELCCISSPSLAGVLARMEQFGFITRKRMEHDQRRVRVALTARSRALAGRVAGEIEATYGRIEALIGKEFCLRTYQMLDQLIATLAPQESINSKRACGVKQQSADVLQGTITAAPWNRPARKSASA